MSDVVSRLLAKLDEVEQCATAAGHGFGHLGLGSLLNLNAGWTKLDLADNVRPNYDQRFVRMIDPDAVLRLCQAHRDLVAEWQKRKQMADLLDADPETKAGEAHILALGIASGLFAAVTVVAAGYGIQEEDRDG